MFLFKKTKAKIDTSLSTHFERIYQYSSGIYLPDSSQPNPNENYEITTRQYTPHKSTRYVNVVIGSNKLPQRQDKDGKFVDSEKKCLSYTQVAKTAVAVPLATLLALRTLLPCGPAKKDFCILWLTLVGVYAATGVSKFVRLKQKIGCNYAPVCID